MQMILRCFAAAALVFALLGAAPSVAEDKKSILITGASTGIGRHLAESLAADGHHVYAGARKDADLAELDAIDNITAVRLDVTKQDQIDAVVAMIGEKGTGLYGLVNNAGVGGGGPIVETPIEEQNFVYDINVEGVYRTTRAFAPLVMESKGRIITTGSIAGTGAGPGWSAYSGSKHWIEALTDALAGEMAPHGVSVSVVEPGNYKSRIRRSSAERRMESLMAGGGELTEEMKERYQKTAERELSYKEPDEVTQAFMHALFDDEPLLRYVVVPNADEQAWVIGTAVRELVQLNAWGPHSYSRDELVQMLDDALNPPAAAQEEAE
ncbi:MAG: SDR family NAD(P)-dependent oxidoreductase [Gammaproteobacteria bacterium]|nr:SDR family NAD(P)-dependent oxidoreductase [Gammaproteobacteria bacterium]